MKKLLIVLLLAGASVASMAQENDATEKYSVATNSFWSNWFIQPVLNGTLGMVIMKMAEAGQRAPSRNSVLTLELLSPSVNGSHLE